MTRLYLKRTKFDQTRTIGTLKTPKQTFFTMEDAVRERLGCPVTDWKIPGKTAIPCGAYPLILDLSHRFKKIMPHILNVEGFSGVRIHAGNTEADTEGCILLGWGVSKDGSGITDSRRAVADFMAEIEDVYDRGEPIEIEIT